MSAEDLLSRAIQNFQELGEKDYVGRGLVVAKNQLIYWVEGRSAGVGESQDRKLVVADDGKSIRTATLSGGVPKQPELLIYNAFRVVDKPDGSKWWVASNGRQTDTIADSVGSIDNFDQALKCWGYEPDKPNFTLREAAALSFPVDGSLPQIFIGTVKRDADFTPREYPDGEPLYDVRERDAFCGIGWMVHTYERNGNPLPEMVGGPRPVTVFGNELDNAKNFWKQRNQNTRVSLLSASYNERSELNVITINHDDLSRVGVDIQYKSFKAD